MTAVLKPVPPAAEQKSSAITIMCECFINVELEWASQNTGE